MNTKLSSHSVGHDRQRLEAYLPTQIAKQCYSPRFTSSAAVAHRRRHRQQQYGIGCAWQHACLISRLSHTRCQTCQAFKGSRDDFNEEAGGSSSSSSSSSSSHDASQWNTAAAAPGGGENVSRPQEQDEQQKEQEQRSSSNESSISDAKWQQLQLAMRKLHALEEYQLLLQQHDGAAHHSSSSSSSSTLKRDVISPRAVTDPSSPANAFPLLDAALLIARHAHPNLDPAAVKQQLDQLAAEVNAGLPEGSRYPLRIIKEINTVLYQVHGLTGNTEDYYHPDNSCINRVLETKKGIPISLSIVYMEVAARVGLPMGGVNLPAHFMIKPLVEDIEWLVDAFNGGELTALQDAEEVLGRLTGYQVKIDPRFVSRDTPPVSSRALLLRLLNNLRQTYLTLNMAEEALSIIRYMQATAPAGSLPELARDEGLCLYRLGRLNEASTVLSTYLASQPDSQDSAVVVALLQRIKQKTAAAQQVQDSSQEQQERET